ncbi:anti-sigma regulatory factor (Ser/Thr protein kinase) [Streptomyces aurantiacus]|uniref:ATP-binding protein n=1 Tax=Streptomyces aurantiacus TaxID=47760 RepID=UPI0027908206|nr:ATP-binding protein [Streptomyces aurantiacus]MDQ0774266.1 anti-sigma regulatory factor (Ser/Thr protein kinase) [Streptomyces aurantiacus]
MNTEQSPNQTHHQKQDLDRDPTSYLLPALDPLSGIPHPPPLPFAAPWCYEVHFPCDPRGPGIARVTLRAVLDAHGLAQLVDRAELLTSELATNSVRHTKGPASVRLQWLCPVLRVSVWDMSPDLPPAPGSPRTGVVAAHAEDGRGLLILDTVADRWGGCAIGEGKFGPGGKTIWFELSLPAAPPPVDSTLAA